MLTALRGRLADGRPDGGFSLVEVLVGMSLSSIVGALMLTWLLGAGDANTATTDSSISAAGARNILQSWSKDLQLAGSPTSAGTGAGRIVSLTPTSIDFYAFLSNASCTANLACAALAPTEIKLSLVNGNLYEQIGAKTNTVALDGKFTTAPTCLFTAATATASLGCSGLTRAQLDSATAMTIAFTLTPPSGHARSYTTTSTFTTYANTGAGNVPLP